MIDYFRALFNRWFGKKKTIKRSRKKKTPGSKMETIKGLLQALDKTFIYLNMKHFSVYTSPHTIKMLKHLGPMVLPTDTYEQLKNSEKINSPEDIPAIVYLANFSQIDSDDKFLYVNGFYAVKQKHIPWFVQPTKGICLEIGFTCPDRLEDNKNYVVGGYIIVTPEGEIVYPKACHHETKGYWPKKGLGFKYNKKVWREQDFCKHLFLSLEGNDQKKKAEMNLRIATPINIYLSRQNYWKVSVRKQKTRATFLIDKERTKYFFKDRDVTVLTPTGQKKKIIHFVSSHLRKTNSKVSEVREHLRGIRQFSWCGYECSVIAPKFHSFDIDDFLEGAVDKDDIAIRKNKIKLLDGKKVTKLLSKTEDDQAASI